MSVLTLYIACTHVSTYISRTRNDCISEVDSIADDLGDVTFVAVILYVQVPFQGVSSRSTSAVVETAYNFMQSWQKR